MKKLIFVYAFLVSTFLFVGCDRQNTAVGTTGEVVVSGDIDAAEPAIAADGDGNLYVVFVAHNADRSADVYLQKFGRNLQQIGKKTRINPEKGQAKAWYGDAPTVKIGADDNLFVGWTATDAAAKSGSILYLSVSRDGGKSFIAPVKVNDDPAPAAHGMHSLAVGADHRILLAWLDERNLQNTKQAQNSSLDSAVEFDDEKTFSDFHFVRAHHDTNQISSEKSALNSANENSQNLMKHKMAEPNREIFFAVSNDGGKTFSKNLKLSSEVCPCCKTNLAIGADGKIYASWRQVLPGDFRHIAVAVSNDSGVSFSAPTIVSDDRWQISACPVSGAPMLVDEKNSLNIFWFTAGKAGETGFYTAQSADGGKTFSPRRLIFGGTIKGTAAIFNAGGNDAGAVFESDGKVFQAGRNPAVSEKISGELPAAVFANGRVFAALIRKSGEKRSVWLAEF